MLYVFQTYFEKKKYFITIFSLKWNYDFDLFIFDWEKNQKRFKPVIVLFLVKPSKVIITNNGGHLSVKSIGELICKVMGSRPPAHITWWKDGKQINTSHVVRVSIITCWKIENKNK